MPSPGKNKKRLERIIMDRGGGGKERLLKFL
jgi:hypothetical protein